MANEKRKKEKKKTNDQIFEFQMHFIGKNDIFTLLYSQFHCSYRDFVCTTINYFIFFFSFRKTYFS